MIDYIVYGEFDINEGSIIKLEYPQKTGINEMVLASYIIPEGTHNIMNDTFCFIVNKKQNAEDLLLESIKKQTEALSLASVNYIDLSIQYINFELQNKIFKLKELYIYNNNSNQWNSVISNVVLTNNNDSKNKELNMLYFKFKKEEEKFNIQIFNNNEIYMTM